MVVLHQAFEHAATLLPATARVRQLGLHRWPMLRLGVGAWPAGNYLHQMAPSFAATYEATPGSIAVVRNQVATLARECGLDARGVGDVKLAVSEAVTNAVVHGYRNGPGRIHVSAEVVAGELVIGVRDDGDGMRPRTDSPGLGLGLPVIASVARRLEIVEDGPGTELRIVFGCPRGRLGRAA